MTPKKILVINPFGIGDTIFSLTVCRTLHQKIPTAKIVFLCNERTEDLVRMDTDIDDVLVFNRDYFRKLWATNPYLFFKKLSIFLKQIKSHRFDVVLDYSLVRQFSFFCFLLGIPKRIGFDYKNRGLYLTHKIKLSGYEIVGVAQKQLELLAFLGIYNPPILSRLPLKTVSSAKENILVVAPGGGRSWGSNAIYKQWDTANFAEAAKRIAEQRSLKIVVLGDDLEKGIVRVVAQKLPVDTVLKIGESFSSLCSILSKADLVLCNDGGILHLANALGTKTLSIYGPVDKNVYGPTGNDTSHKALSSSVPCGPCYKNFHFPICRHNRICLTNISVETVVHEAKILLNL